MKRTVYNIRNLFVSRFYMIVFIVGILVSCGQRERDGDEAPDSEPGEEMSMDAYEEELQELEQIENEKTMERFPDNQFEYRKVEIVVGGNPSLIMSDEEWDLAMEDHSLDATGRIQEGNAGEETSTENAGGAQTEEGTGESTE